MVKTERRLPICVISPEEIWDRQWTSFLFVHKSTESALSHCVKSVNLWLFFDIWSTVLFVAPWCQDASSYCVLMHRSFDIRWICQSCKLRSLCLQVVFRTKLSIMTITESFWRDDTAWKKCHQLQQMFSCRISEIPFHFMLNLRVRFYRGDWWYDAAWRPIGTESTRFWVLFVD